MLRSVWDLKKFQEEEVKIILKCSRFPKFILVNGMPIAYYLPFSLNIDESLNNKIGQRLYSIKFTT